MTVGEQAQAQHRRGRTALVAAVLAVPVSSTALWAASASAASVPPPVTGTAPGAPTGVVATPADHQAAVRFTRPVSTGSTPITSYRIRATDQTSAARGGESALSTGSVTKAPPTVATVTGLTDGDRYTFTVIATNSTGPGPASQPSKPVIPHAADPIVAHYNSLGAAHSLLGSPVGAEYAVAGGRAQNYQHGRIYFSARTGAYSVHGAILVRYAQLKFASGPLGYPVTDEYAVTGGRRSDFVHGTIVYKFATRTTTVTLH